MKQGFKPKSIDDIKVGMKVLFGLSFVPCEWKWKLQGTVRYVGPVYEAGPGNHLGVEIDPGEGEY